jgi:hypothetical protein
MPYIKCESCDYWDIDMYSGQIGLCTHIGDTPTADSPYIWHAMTTGKGETVRLLTPRLFGCNHHSALEQIDTDLQYEVWE